MNIALIGASGLVGSHLARRWAGAHQLLRPTHAALDITDAAAVKAWCRAAQPALIVNCTVLDVDRCEREPELAEAINVTGPRALAEAAQELNAQIIHFSTNYVFAGDEHGRIYTQADATEPINVYGRTKLAGERAVLAACAGSYILRTSWVFGRGKENFLSTVARKLRAGESIRAITDVWASATYAVDLAERTEAILQRHAHGIYHVVNNGVLSYHEFAQAAAHLAGLHDADEQRLIECVSEDEAQRLAARPRFTPMRCALSETIGLPPMRDWRAALAEYVTSSR